VRLRRRGLSLPEIIVASAVLGLLTTMAFGVLVPALHGVHKAERDVESQQAAVMALDKLFHQAAFSDQRSVTIFEDDERTILSFLSADPPGVTGTAPLPANFIQTSGQSSAPIVWQKFWVLIYDKAEDTLTVREYPYAGASELAALNKATLSDVLLEAPAVERVLGRGITEFQAVVTRPRVLHVELESQRDASDRERKTRLSTDIAMRQTL